MDLDVRNSDIHENNKLDVDSVSVSQKEKHGVAVDREEEEEDESNALLAPRRGGMSKRPTNVRRKVQWNDRNGNKLVEVLEFQPSDTSDSDDDEGTDSCLCVIM